MKSWTALGVAVFREHRALLWLIGLQIETSWWMCIVADRPLLIGLENAYVGVLAATLIFGVMALATALVRRRRRSLSPVESYREALSSLCSEVLTARWIGSLVIFLVVLPLSLAMFSAAKQTIPVIHPFAWDATIEQIPYARTCCCNVIRMCRFDERAARELFGRIPQDFAEPRIGLDEVPVERGYCNSDARMLEDRAKLVPLQA